MLCISEIFKQILFNFKGLLRRSPRPNLGIPTVPFGEVMNSQKLDFRAKPLRRTPAKRQLNFD